MNKWPGTNVPTQIDVKKFTKDEVIKILNKEDPNRSTRYTHVNELAATMNAGKWYWNGDSIRFNAQGQLVDGQHRLRAFAKSTLVEIYFVVVEDLTDAAVNTIDLGAKRSLGDQLDFLGQDYGNSKTALKILQLVHKYESNGERGKISLKALTPGEIIPTINKYGATEVVAKQGRFQNLRNALSEIPSVAVSGAVCLILGGHSKFDNFYDDLMKSTPSNSATRELKNFMYNRNIKLGGKGGAGSGTGSAQQGQFLNVFFFSWNKFIKNKTVTPAEIEKAFNDAKITFYEPDEV